jgi:hypothetical protein
VDVALFVSVEVLMTGDPFVDFDGLLKAGHSTQSRCWADKRPTVAVLVKEVAR